MQKINLTLLVSVSVFASLLSGCSTTPSIGVDAPVEKFSAKDAELVGDQNCECDAEEADHKLTKKQADDLGIKTQCESCADKK